MIKKKSILWVGLFVACTTTTAVPVMAQDATKPVVTTSDYQRAERMLAYNTAPLTDNLNIRPTWLQNDRFWYRSATAGTSNFIIVDPAAGKKMPAFDHEKVAKALATATGKTIGAGNLPFTSVEFAADEKSFQFYAENKGWNYNIQTGTLTEAARNQSAGRGRAFGAAVSPDGKKSAFIRDNNLWVKDIATNKETQLTTDGAKDFGYATDNAGWRKSENPILAWSPDSKKIATYQQDQRNVSDMYLVSTNVGKPTLQTWKYPLPGDKYIPMLHRVIIEVDQPKVIRLNMPPDPHRSTLGDDVSSGGNFSDVEWNKEGTQLAFVSTTRDHKQATLYIADAATGAIRKVMEEKATTQFEGGQKGISWRYLPASNEVLWYSERDDNGHLYLYNATTGAIKNQVTKGPFTVVRLVKVDEKNRTVYFTAGGKEAGRNPYHAYLYKVGFDGKQVTLLTPDEGDHQVTLSPSGKFLFDTYSRHDMPPVSAVRDLNGKLVVPVEKSDISRLTATGWKAPTPITVKNADGSIDLYGVMYTPSKLDPTKKYPIINYIYPGPQGGSVGSWSFQVAKGDNQALAELGFVVVAIEGTCNPLRSKSFHDKCYGNMAENTLPDQIAGMKQLAAKYPYIDIDRAGIWGHSGGGYATAAAMFRFPEFFKVGISESGNHDNRNYEDDWGERYIGLETRDANGKSNYEDQANQNYAKNLKGKLLLAHGLMDDNVPPSNTLLVVDALVKANKDFDLILFPQARHGFGESSMYMTRRRWDYFVKHLLGATPPENYELNGR